jgi:hypothetical protein
MGGQVRLGGSGAPPLAEAWIGLYDDPHGWGKKGSDSVLIEWPERTKFSLRHLDDVSGDFGDNVSALIWYAPVGEYILLYEDEDYDRDGWVLKLLGTGQVEWIGNLDGFHPSDHPHVVEIDSGGEDYDDNIDGLEFSRAGAWGPQFAWSDPFGQPLSGLPVAGADPLIGARDNGEFTARLTVKYGTTAGSDDALVRVSNVAPTVDAGNDQSGVDEGALVNLDPAAFTDPGTLDTHIATIGWGDGAIVLGTVSETLGSGTVAGTHRYRDNGQYNVTVAVTDDDADFGSSSFQVTVDNVAPTVDAGDDQSGVDEGALVQLDPATFTDPGLLDTHVSTVGWGDGTTETGAVSEANGSGTVACSHRYGDNGEYGVTVTVTDDDGGAGSSGFQITVNNVAPTVDAGDDQSGVDEGALVQLDPAAFTDPGTLDTHSATIRWGDGTEEAGAVSETNGSGAVSGSHRYSDDAPYDVTVTVTDDDAGAGSAGFRVTVRNVAPSVSSITMEQPLPDVILPAVHELRFSASFSDPGWADTHTAKWSFGDGSASAGALTQENLPPDATGTIAVMHTYATPGTYTVTALVVDDDGGSSQRQISLTVTSASEAVRVLDGYLTNLPNSALTGNPAARRKAWSNQCGALANTLKAEAYGAAGKILTDLRRRCDGSLGGKAQNDWVSSSKAQASICALIDALREYLETLE